AAVPAGGFDADLVAEGLPHHRRGDLVRGPVLPAAPVRVPRGSGGSRGSRPAESHGTAAAGNDPHRRRARARIRRRDPGNGALLSPRRLVAREARIGAAAGDLSCGAGEAHPRLCGGSLHLVLAKLALVQRSARRAVAGDRDPRGGEALLIAPIPDRRMIRCLVAGPARHFEKSFVARLATTAVSASVCRSPA